MKKPITAENFVRPACPLCKSTKGYSYVMTEKKTMMGCWGAAADIGCKDVGGLLVGVVSCDACKRQFKPAALERKGLIKLPEDARRG